MEFTLVKAAASDDEVVWDAAQQELLGKMIYDGGMEITANMLPFLKREKVVKLLIQVVTQRQDGESNVVIMHGREDGFEWKRLGNYACEDDPHVYERLQEEDGAAYRRSYNVMEFLCGMKQKMDQMAPAESYHARMKLVEDPSPACRTYLRESGPLLFAYLFDAFHPQSAASLYHVCKIMVVMMRFAAEFVIKSFLKNKRALKDSIEAMLDYIEYPCVSDTILTILCPIATTTKEQMSGDYAMNEETRRSYFRMLSNSNILLSIGKHLWIVGAPDDHKSAAGELLQNVIQRFAAIQGGSDILDSLVRSVDLLNGLMLVACGEEHLLHQAKPAQEAADDWLVDARKTGGSSGKNKKKKGKNNNKKKKGKNNNKNKKKQQNQQKGNDNDEDDDDDDEEEDEEKKKHIEHSVQRDAALDTLRCIVDLSTKKYVPCAIMQEYTSFADSGKNVIECQLGPIAERLHTILEGRFDDLCHAISDPTSFVSEEIGSNVRHTSYVVETPFSNYRLELIKVIVTCVKHKPRALLGKLSNTNWATLTKWFLDYPHCNLYHAEYRELFDTLLREKDASHPILPFVLFDCNLLINMIDHFQDEQKRTRESVSGHILYMLNAIRLQADTLPPHHGVKIRLQEDRTWQQFLPILREETLKLVQPWIKSDPALFVQNTTIQKQQEIAKLTNPPEEDQVDIDLGSTFADDLGFKDVKPYTSSKKK